MPEGCLDTSGMAERNGAQGVGTPGVLPCHDVGMIPKQRKVHFVVTTRCYLLMEEAQPQAIHVG